MTRARLCAVLAVAGALAGARGAQADTVPVAIEFQTYSPSPVHVLVGDTVMWTNTSLRNHTVTDATLGIDSPTIFPHAMFSWRFAQTGTYPYYCRLHAFMGGQVQVDPVLLSAPARVVAARQPLTLTGRAQAGVRAVAIEGDSGHGFATLTTVPAGSDGRFSAVVRPQVTTTFRATAGADHSPSIRITAVDRHVAVTARAGSRGRTTITARVTPAARGLPVLIEAYLRNRFGWWPLERVATDRHGQARWTTALGGRTRLRAVLVERDGWTPETVSPVVLAGRR